MIRQPSNQIIRYCINGVVATAIHYIVFVINVEIVQLSSAGVSNMIASCVGISTSFLGSRNYVFPKTGVPILKEFAKFSGLYGAIAVLHATVLLVWTDFFELNYKIGFVVATGFQFSLSYFGNKNLVFQNEK